MRIALVLECGRDGPDQLVLEHLITGRLRPGTVVKSFTLGNKAALMEECGRLTASILDPTDLNHCDRVIIVWDRKPYWGGRGATCEDNKVTVQNQLRAAGVGDGADVHMICIEAELEAWLLTDGRAIRAVLSEFKGRDVGSVTVPREPHRIDDPKRSLERIFTEKECRAYQPHADAIRIVKAMPDLQRLGSCASFQAFRASVEA